MPNPPKIEEEAALWVAKLEYGLTPAEQDQFLEWLTADPRHGRELARQNANWTRLNVLADWRPEHAVRPNRDLLAPSPVDSARPRSRRAIWWLAGTSLAAAATVAAMLLLPRDRAPAAPAATASTRVVAIERRTLADHSVVELNRGAEVSVHYSAAERRVRLAKGEANFTVAQNPDRPFIVTAAGVGVRALGTVFNVRLSATAVEVLVTEGRVQVQPPEGVSDLGQTVVPATVFVGAGERATVSLTKAGAVARVTPLSAEQIDQLLAWQPKWLDFTEAPLRHVLDEFNRRNAPVCLVLADPELSDTVVSASLRSDNVENFLHLLASSFGVSAERTGDVITLRRTR